MIPLAINDSLTCGDLTNYIFFAQRTQKIKMLFRLPPIKFIVN